MLQRCYGDGACFYYALLWSLQRLGLEPTARRLDGAVVRYDEFSVRRVKQKLLSASRSMMLQQQWRRLPEGLQVVLRDDGASSSAATPLLARLSEPRNACELAHYAGLTEVCLAALAYRVRICVHNPDESLCFHADGHVGELPDVAESEPTIHLRFDRASLHYDAWPPTGRRRYDGTAAATFFRASGSMTLAAVVASLCCLARMAAS